MHCDKSAIWILIGIKKSHWKDQMVELEKHSGRHGNLVSHPGSATN